MSAQLPPHSSLRQLKNRAKDLRRAVEAGDPEALNRVREHHPRRAGSTLQDAQLVIAREYGFDSWPKLAASLEPAAPATPALAVVGTGPHAVALRASLARAAACDLPVLLVGEGGVGKRFAARLLHAQSRRAAAPFAQMSCDVENETLAESELLGHEPGAFTGAHALRRGRLEETDGGTLVLDEVGALSPLAQRGLVEWFESGAFRRLGGGDDLAADVRLAATTSRDLKVLVEAGRFRADLYYRLQALRIQLPPLKDRLEDVPELARHFAAGVAGDRAPAFSDAALALLAAHPWPGNVRELRHVAEAAAVAASGAVIDTDHIHLEPSAAPQRAA